MPLGFGPLHPRGMIENSPAFQRWDSPQIVQSPAGTAEKIPFTGQSSALSRPFGTRLPGWPNPALKRWAIAVCPSGTASFACGYPRLDFKSWWHWTSRSAASRVSQPAGRPPVCCFGIQRKEPLLNSSHLPPLATEMTVYLTKFRPFPVWFFLSPPNRPHPFNPFNRFPRDPPCAARQTVRCPRG